MQYTIYIPLICINLNVTTDFLVYMHTEQTKKLHVYKDNEFSARELCVK